MIAAKHQETVLAELTGPRKQKNIYLKRNYQLGADPLIIYEVWSGSGTRDNQRMDRWMPLFKNKNKPQGSPVRSPKSHLLSMGALSIN